MITLDDGNSVKDLKDFGFIVSPSYKIPAQPSFERKTVSIPGKVGTWEFGTEISERPIEIPVKYITISEAEFQVKINEFNQFFYDEFGKPKRLKLIYEFEKDRYLDVKIAQNFVPDTATTIKSFEIPFIANNPNKYSRFFPDEITWGSHVIDFTFPYRFGLGSKGEGKVVDKKINAPQTISVIAEGLTVKPVLFIEGSGTDVSISNNGSVINVGTFTNTKWEIDCENYISYKNGSESFLNINEFWILPSINTLSITGTSLNFKFSVTFRNRYL